MKLINKKGMLKSSVIIDELPTIYFKGLDNLIATARSNKVAMIVRWLGDGEVTMADFTENVVSEFLRTHRRCV